MNCTPLITIGLPTFNREKYLPFAIESALNQTYANIELLICDNASTDSTPEIIREYASRDPRIRYYRNNTNIGPNANINRLYDLARGEFFIGIGDDDIFLGNNVSRLYNLLISTPACQLAKSAFEVIDATGKVIDHFNDFLECETSEAYMRRKVIYGTWQPWPGILCRTELLREVGGIVDILGVSRFADTFLYFRIGSKGDYVVGSREYLWKYRIHNQERTFHVCPRIFCENVPEYLLRLENLARESGYSEELICLIRNEYGQNLMRSILNFELPHIRDQSFSLFMGYLVWYVRRRKALRMPLGFQELIAVALGCWRYHKIFRKVLGIAKKLSGTANT